jgi:hypothetical protein
MEIMSDKKRNNVTKKGKVRIGRPRKGELTIPDRKVMLGILQGKNPTQAMRDAGYAAATANTKAGKKLQKLAPTIQKLMEQRGLSDDRLLDVLDDGLRANKVISCNIIALDKNGMKDADSMTKDFVDVDDHPTRHKFLETALKLKGHMDKKDDQAGVTIIINAERHD